jgi:hypothetical protein
MFARRWLPLLLLSCALPLQAQVYTWVDENGQKHFGNQPPATQVVKEVKINQGYVSDGPPPQAAGVTSSATGESSADSQGSDDQKMCSEAMRWTAIDLPNLKEIAGERKQRGDLTSEQYNQAVKALDQAESEITLQSCLASTGKEREQYKCLSGGAGVLVCSGALGTLN